MTSEIDTGTLKTTGHDDPEERSRAHDNKNFLERLCTAKGKKYIEFLLPH
jgi:hypothetical protein